MLVRRWMIVLLFAVCTTRRSAAFIWPNAAERIERQLTSEVASERQAAARQLSKLPRSVAERLIPIGLGDGDVRVRLASVDAALKYRVPGASDLVIPWLNDPERRIRMAAIELLRVSPSEAATGPLGRTLSDPDPSIRHSAAEALGASRAPAATLQLLSHLDDSVPRVREAIARALAQLGDPRAVVPLIGKIQDSHASVRASVARALGELGDARASAALVVALGDADEEVRAAAAHALGRLGQDGTTLSLVSLVEEDPSPVVRQQALWALGALASPAAVEALIGYLGKDSGSGADVELGQLSVVALEELGEQALGPLTRCVQSELSEPRANGCARVLGRLRRSSAVPALTAALRAGRIERSVGLAALGEIGDPAGLPAALEYLGVPDAGVRSAALAACGRLLETGAPEGRAVDPLTAALNAPHVPSSERAEVARVLGLTRSKRAAKPLMTIATDADDVALKRVALEALGSLGPAGQQQVLLEALDDPEPAVRSAAALALRDAAGSSTAGELLRRLRRVAEQDRQALLLALTGAMRRNEDPAVTRALADLAEASRGGTRDALLEALGNARTKGARGVLASLFERPLSVADRAKLAEAFAAHSGAVPDLLRLAQDADGSVRANAVWALGSVARQTERAVLAELMRDRDAAVAGNAAAALGRMAQRTGLDVKSELCAALTDERSYVRANALGALRLTGKRCPRAQARQLLGTDSSPAVRERAAALLSDVPGTQPEQDRQALRHCVMEEPMGRVAARCKTRVELPTGPNQAVTVLVVPSGESSPVARAPFALILADGLLRLGLTDRRGAVYEHAAPRGELSLAVPAALAE